MSEANHQAPEFYPRTQADVEAEQKAEAAWGEPTQPVGATAVESTVELITPGDTEQFGMTDGGVLVTDKRRLTPESAEADYQAHQEKLRQPLSSTEYMAVTDKAIQAIEKQREAHGSMITETIAAKDLEGDSRAFSRLHQIFNGKAIGVGRDQSNVYDGLSPKERLADLVSMHTKLTADIPHIGSMGGAVDVDPVTHEVHFGGYNNGNLYVFARAAQVLDKLEADPARARTETDLSWLTAEPVVVEPVPEVVSQTA